MQNIKPNNSSEKKWCVIIPTFNNDKTLEKVLKEVLNICKNIIVVNDGSDDNTSQILKNFSDTIDVITHKENKGKGKSLRDAFEYAIKKDFEYGITIDSDGQHYPADINLFVEAIAKHPDSIIVGARDMNQDGILNILDIVLLVNAIMSDEPTPAQLASGDINNDNLSWGNFIKLRIEHAWLGCSHTFGLYRRPMCLLGLSLSGRHYLMSPYVLGAAITCMLFMCFDTIMNTMFL